jgi:hypothetical protein
MASLISSWIFLEGQSSSRPSDSGPLPPGEVIAIICEAAIALDVAHAAGVSTGT